MFDTFTLHFLTTKIAFIEDINITNSVYNKIIIYRLKSPSISLKIE